MVLFGVSNKLVFLLALFCLVNLTNIVTGHDHVHDDGHNDAHHNESDTCDSIGSVNSSSSTNGTLNDDYNNYYTHPDEFDDEHEHDYHLHCDQPSTLSIIRDAVSHLTRLDDFNVIKLSEGFFSQVFKVS